jgi:hypothetical protein
VRQDTLAASLELMNEKGLPLDEQEFDWEDSVPQANSMTMRSLAQWVPTMLIIGV